MKRLAVLVTSLFLVLSLSQAKTTTDVQAPIYQGHSSLKTRTQTKNVLVRAIPKHKRQVLAANLDFEDPDDFPGTEELDLHVAYRRPGLVKDAQPADEVSDYVSIRLAVARARALERYNQKYCKAGNETV
jgi:hypothetical protein